MKSFNVTIDFGITLPKH